MTRLRFRSSDLELFPDDGKRYEIIDGELYVSKRPGWDHQVVCGSLFYEIESWSRRTGAGFVGQAPGVIFADDDDVAPDLVWVSKERLATTLGPDRKLHAAPELIVEVLSPGAHNERRDREAKLSLYSRRGVKEYWIVDWQRRQIEVYRRANLELHLVATHAADDVLTSPLLPGFEVRVSDLFARLPESPADIS